MVEFHPQYTEYEVSIYSKVVCLWFTKSSVSTTELILKLKPLANNIRISSNLTYDAISPPIDYKYEVSIDSEVVFLWFTNGNLPQSTNAIGLSKMTPRSQLIFDKSDSVRSRIEECKNHCHTLKLKHSEVIIIKAAKILAYMSLNSS